MSRFLGTGEEKAGNIGGIVLFCAFISMTVASAYGVEKVADASIHIITLTLGYVFGTGRRPKE